MTNATFAAPVNYDPTDPDKMRLPAGTTCGDCVHIYRCKTMFGHTETDTSCDWSPSRFRAAAKDAATRPRTCLSCGAKVLTRADGSLPDGGMPCGH